MRSKQLLEELKAKYGTAYQIYKISGVSESRLSLVKSKDNRNFQADELLKFYKAGMINKTTMLMVSFADRLKNDELLKLVASFATVLPTMQICFQFLNENVSQCILC